MSSSNSPDHPGSILYHSESSEVTYSTNQELVRNFFCCFLQQIGSQPAFQLYYVHLLYLKVEYRNKYVLYIIESVRDFLCKLAIETHESVFHYIIKPTKIVRIHFQEMKYLFEKSKFPKINIIKSWSLLIKNRMIRSSFNNEK